MEHDNGEFSAENFDFGINFTEYIDDNDDDIIIQASQEAEQQDLDLQVSIYIFNIVIVMFVKKMYHLCTTLFHLIPYCRMSISVINRLNHKCFMLQCRPEP